MSRTLSKTVIFAIASARLQGADGALHDVRRPGAVHRALGVYGLLSFLVTSRTHALGVRTAIGAQRRDLVRLIAVDSAGWMACGLAGGLALAVGVGRVMRSMIHGVEPLDWISLGAAVLLLATVGALAALRPVWRATRLDPVTVLRAE